MIKLLLTICLTFFYSFLFCQKFSWAVNTNASSGDYIAHDKNGNLYIANSRYVAKFNKSGSMIWQDTIQGNAFWNAGVVGDNSGNLYLAIVFGGTVSIQNYTLASSTTSGWDSNMALAKYDTSGKVVWVSRSISVDDSGPDDLTIDQNGNIILIGRFQDSLHIDGFSFYGGSTNQAYIAKYSPNGNCIWAKHLHANSFGGGNPGGQVACDFNNNIYFASYYITNVQIDALNVTAHGGYGDDEVCLAKLDSNGNVQWLNTMGGAGPEYFYTMDVDSLGNTYVGGEYMSHAAYFGAHTLTTSFDDYFVTKYNSAGICAWAKKAVAPSLCVINDGYYTSSPGIITRYDSSGTFQWSKPVVGKAGCYAITATNDATFITGTDSGTVNFDTCNTTSVNWQMFVAKLSILRSAVGIKQATTPSKISFSVYPNPANYFVTLDYTSSFQNAIILTVKNSLGQNVYNESVKEISGSISKQIDLSHLPKGIYFVELICGNNVSTKKVVLE